MQTMFKAYFKAKKAGRSIKCKKHDYDSSDSFDSKYETGYKDTCFSIVDKHLEINKPLGNVYLSTETRPIKVVDTAPSTSNSTRRADEIAIETANTNKVTAVVAVMRFFCKKKCKSWRAIPGNRKPSFQKAESENSRKPRNLSQKTRKGQLPKKLAPILKKLELNSNSLKLKSKKLCQDCAKKPDPSVSYGLEVKNKTIRVLLDSGSSGDLLFVKKKGPVNTFLL